jgi:hypothetical protein
MPAAAPPVAPPVAPRAAAEVRGDVEPAPRPGSMTIVITSKRCHQLRRDARWRFRFRCYGSDVDRAVHEVDQSPRQLRR